MPSKTVQKELKPPSKRGSKPAKKRLSNKGCSRQISEKELHLHAWQWIQKAYPHLLIFHVPSGEHRDIVTAMKLKRMGVVPGVADFLMFIPGVNVAIELKHQGGKQSNEQKMFQLHWELLGHRYEIARSLAQFQQIVESYYGTSWPWAKQSEPTSHPS